MAGFILVKILSLLVMPPASLLVGLVVGLLLYALGRNRLALLAVGAALLQTLLMSFPPLSDALMGHLEEQARAAERDTPRCCFDAILVLGGGVAPAIPPERDFPSLTGSADRVWLAARLFKKGVAPHIIVSGGGFLAQSNALATTEAEAMRVFLMDLGVPSEAIIDEGKSNNTAENIFNVRAMLQDRPVAMITSAFHMPRAMQIARRAKLNFSAFPTNYRALPSTRPSWEDWLPTMEGLEASIIALHEILAIAFDRRGEAAPK
jgi:uncharacterized SAM-binding protein YcdF (DUF218 family)